MVLKPLRVDLKPADKSVERTRQNRRRDRLRQVPKEVSSTARNSNSGLVELISFDPGGTTGWSLMQVHPSALSARDEDLPYGVLDNITTWRHGQVDCGSVKGNLGRSLHAGISTRGENAGVSELLGLCRSWPQAAIVIEDFILDPDRFNTGRDLLSPVRITSALNYDLWLQRRDYYVQSASLAKTTCRDEQLKTWGYYTSSGGLGHARDADRHSLTFLKRSAARSPKGRELREAAWPHLFGPEGEYYDPGKRKR